MQRNNKFDQENVFFSKQERVMSSNYHARKDDDIIFPNTIPGA